MAIVLAACTLSGCSLPDEVTPVSKTGLYFDTVITITLYGRGKQSYIDNCFKMAEKYEKLLSATLPESDISRINSGAGSPVDVSPDSLTLISTSLSYADESNGAFDPTIGVISSLWDFEENRIPPSDSLISERLKYVDYRQVVLTDSTVTIPEGFSIDLGAIAKGYIADKMKEYLVSEGVESGIINLGGNILLVGSRPDGADYTLAIQKPFEEEGTPAFKLQRSDCSVVTSGTYERYFEYEGRLYHHLLDTKTGYPIENDISSITVITKKSTDADALSTMLFALGKDSALDYAASHEDVDVIIITDEGEILSTTDIVQ